MVISGLLTSRLRFPMPRPLLAMLLPRPFILAAPPGRAPVTFAAAAICAGVNTLPLTPLAVGATNDTELDSIRQPALGWPHFDRYSAAEWPRRSSSIRSALPSSSRRRSSRRWTTLRRGGRQPPRWPRWPWRPRRPTKEANPRLEKESFKAELFIEGSQWNIKYDGCSSSILIPCLPAAGLSGPGYAFPAASAAFCRSSRQGQMRPTLIMAENRDPCFLTDWAHRIWG